MRVNVTSEHIRRGVRWDLDGCALARAISDEVGTKVAVGIGVWFIPGLEGSYPLPEVAKKVRSDFDAGLEIKPFSFELNEESEASAEILIAESVVEDLVFA